MLACENERGSKGHHQQLESTKTAKLKEDNPITTRSEEQRLASLQSDTLS